MYKVDHICTCKAPGPVEANFEKVQNLYTELANFQMEQGCSKMCACLLGQDANADSAEAGGLKIFQSNKAYTHTHCDTHTHTHTLRFRKARRNLLTFAISLSFEIFWVSSCLCDICKLTGTSAPALAEAGSPQGAFCFFLRFFHLLPVTGSERGCSFYGRRGGISHWTHSTRVGLWKVSNGATTEAGTWRWNQWIFLERFLMWGNNYKGWYSNGKYGHPYFY